MLALDYEMFKFAVQKLRQDAAVAPSLDIYATDKQVNRSERDVRRKVITHLSLAGNQVSPALVAARLAMDIERIGDHTKNIFELAGYYKGKLNVGTFEEKLARLEQQVGELFEKTASTMRDGDKELAREIMSKYKEELASEIDGIVQMIVSGETSEFSPHTAATLALYVRNLKRIASHLRAVASSVVNPFHRIGYKEKALD